MLLFLFLLLESTRLTLCQELNSSTSCLFDDRMNALRCQDTDWRTVHARLNEIAREVSLVFVNFCDIRVLPARALLLNHTNRISGVSVVNSGLERLDDDALAGLEDSLEHLDLSGNLLTVLPMAVLNLTRLVSLDLGRNRIGQLPPGSAFNNLNTLVRLDLSHNLLGHEDTDSSPDLVSQKRLARRPLNLLSFNLEPLTDTLEELYLRDNGFRGLPKQLQDRQFARLRILDISQNPLGGLKQLESLNLELTLLQTLFLGEEDNEKQEESVLLPHLRELRLSGNPLRCDCHARWLWSWAKLSGLKAELPKCATPFSVRNLELTSLKDSELCELLPGKRIPRFFRVSDQDRSSFPPMTFESLTLTSVFPSSDTQLSVTWQLKVDFYFSEYDWGLIFREVGDGDNSNLFYKTNYDLGSHIESNPSWSPQNETISTLLSGLKTDSFYEICLAAIDHSTVYYIHRNNCREVRMPSSLSNNKNDNPVSTSNVTFAADISSITVVWKSGNPTRSSSSSSIVRRITLRPFGTDNTTQLYVLEDFNRTSNGSSRYYTLSHLQPSTAYLVCFDTVLDQEHGNESSLDLYSSSSSSSAWTRSPTISCKELITLSEEEAFPVREVAAATAASTSATVLVAAIICCCCFPGCCRKKKNKKRSRRDGKKEEDAAAAAEDQGTGSRDENDNHHIKSEDDDDDEDGDGDTLKLDEDNDASAELSSNHFRATMVSENGGLKRHAFPAALSAAAAEESIFQERYSNATLPKSNNEVNQSSVSRRFWQSCLSPSAASAHSAQQAAASNANSSLYSQYDYTVHSEAAAVVVGAPDTQTPHDSRGAAGNSIHRGERPSRKEKRKRAPSPTDASAAGDIHPHHHHKGHSRRRHASPLPEPSFHQPNNYGGNYHTISHFEFYRRPAFHYYTCQQPPSHPPPPAIDYFHPHFRVVPPPSLDYARTLGRTRRESPMAMIPPPQSVLSQPQAFELKPLSLKKLRKNSRSPSKKSGENYKMYTWSPYSSSVFYADRMTDAAHQPPPPRSVVAAATVDYPYQLREPFLGRKRIDELRF